jgi:hypothetical protein
MAMEDSSVVETELARKDIVIEANTVTSYQYLNIARRARNGDVRGQTVWARVAPMKMILIYQEMGRSVFHVFFF